MTNHKIKFPLILYAFCFFLISCEDFVEVEVPDHKIVSKTLFANDETAMSAMKGVYNQLFNTSFANGNTNSVTFLAGLSADNFMLTTPTNELLEFGQNNITAPNSFDLELWASAYNMIYMNNAILEGIENSTALSEETGKTLEGEAKFVRAFTYFYLTNLYGEVPLLLSTDYRRNAVAPRVSEVDIYEQVKNDLLDATELLGDSYNEEDRTKPNRYTAMALLARVALYQNDWQQAEFYSNQVIAQTSLYELLEDPNDVFLANSQEAIWQISPIGWGSAFTHTHEGNLFIKTPTDDTPAVLSDDFMGIWDTSSDKRLLNWVDSFSENSVTDYYPYKYKIQYDASGGASAEYSMVLRLAEQYLIRAEARTHMGDLNEAVDDINKIRERAGIPFVAESQPNVSQEELLTIIWKERRKELFAEWGHRWFDLKRTDRSFILAEKENSDWQNTDLQYPIPADERMKNANLTQNTGY